LDFRLIMTMFFLSLFVWFYSDIEEGGLPNLSPRIYALAVIILVGITTWYWRSEKKHQEMIIKQREINKSKKTTKQLHEYCYYCGASMPHGAAFCKNCRKSQKLD